MRTAVSPKGHKLGFTAFAVSVSCECGWQSNIWYGKGARRNALSEWRSHQDKHIALTPQEGKS